MIYLDSSALVKRYVKEKGSEKVNLVSSSDTVVTSKITYAEILSGLSRKRREKCIGEKDFQTAIERFEIDWEILIIIELQDELLPIIKNLLLSYTLKGADAIHLASCLWFKKNIKEDVTFVASDKPLINIAIEEGIKTLIPED